MCPSDPMTPDESPLTPLTMSAEQEAEDRDVSAWATSDDGDMWGEYLAAKYAMSRAHAEVTALRTRLAEVTKENERLRADHAAEVELLHDRNLETTERVVRAALDLAALRADHAAVVRALRDAREAIYPIVIEGFKADANEDAPEFVNDEIYTARRCLPDCPACKGVGATDGKEYVDEAIPEAVRCTLCEGWGLPWRWWPHPKCAKRRTGCVLPAPMARRSGALQATCLMH